MNPGVPKIKQKTLLCGAATVVCAWSFASASFANDQLNTKPQGTQRAADAAANRPLIKGKVSASGLIDALEIAGIKCVLREDKTKTLIVNSVHMGTAAYYAGIAQDDVIRAIATVPGGLQLTLERSGKTFQTFLRSEAAARELATSANDFNLIVSSQQPNLTKQSPKPSAEKNQLQGRTTATGLQGEVQKKRQTEDKKLLDYNIELVIDISGSMHEEDGTNGLSKFDWCRDQVTSLSERLAPYARNLTITVFNERYQTAESCNRDAVLGIYSQVQPHGSTDLVDPLMARCESALANYRPGGKPTLIAVITDGLPNHPRDPFVVNQALINYTKRLSSPKQVIITFLQIGDGFDGQEFCLDLDQNLVKEGAAYDIVDTRTFAQLKSEGLTQALIHAIEKDNGKQK